MDTPAAIVIKGDGTLFYTKRIYYRHQSDNVKDAKSLFYFYPSFCFYPLLQKYHNILWYADVVGIFYV